MYPGIEAGKISLSRPIASSSCFLSKGATRGDRARDGEG